MRSHLAPSLQLASLPIEAQYANMDSTVAQLAPGANSNCASSKAVAPRPQDAFDTAIQLIYSGMLYDIKAFPFIEGKQKGDQ